MVRGRDIRAAHAIDVVDSAYRLDGTEAEWLAALLAHARPDLDSGCGVYAFTGNESVPNLSASPVFVAHDLHAGFAERLEALNRDTPSAIYDLLRTRLVTCGGLERTLGAGSPIVQHFRALMEPTGVTDGFSMFAQDAEGGSVTMSAPARSVVDPAPRVRGIWARVGLHIAAALRLRRRLAAGATVHDALLDPSGKIADASGEVRDDRAAKAALTRAVQAMDRARSDDMRASPERALDLWEGLVAGEWSLVDQWERGGRRYVAAYRNRPSVRDPRACTPTERAVLRYLALGATNKDIAYALGLPAGTVSTSVSRIMRKLRIHRRVDLAVFADPSRLARIDLAIDTGGELGVLALDARPLGAAAASLSAAELEVAAYVMRGFANDRIARERRVSMRTIANQLRSIYGKLGITNRNQLASALTSPRP
jgi:DNA-binding NarL/FixJ family response regulator